MADKTTSRICVFCESDIPDGAPPEHVIPQWTAKFRPKGMVFRHVAHPSHRGNTEYPPDRPIFSSKKFELTADTICPTCNHGWMSDLETHSSPILTPMIEGKPQGLTIDQQVLVSRWVVKTTLTWDQSVTPANRMYPLAFCHWLYKQQLPPVGGMVRLGRFRDSRDWFVEMESEGLYRSVPDDPVSPSPPDAYRTTIRIGQLVTEFTVAKDPGLVLRATGGDIANLLITVWPSTTLTSWPPRLAFDAAAFDSFLKPEV